MEITKYEQWETARRQEECERALTRAGVSPLVAGVLAARGVDTPAQAAAWLDKSADRLPDPMLLRDMDAAVDRITRALREDETIAVYGDYDVDGITATCLLASYLSARGAHVIPYVPDRLREGYSLNVGALVRLRQQGVSLVVCVDCGITSLAEVAYAADLGLDVIITDHHECREELPGALAVVNPCRPDCPYPFKELAGVGVALKLALALTPEHLRGQVLSRYGDLAAIGTVADVMALTGENRSIVALGLEVLERRNRPGLAQLLRECGLDGKPLTSSTVGYTLAPRLNAAGRMGCPLVAVELLLCQDPVRGTALAHDLYELNRERQIIEQEIYVQCVQMLEQQPDLGEDAVVLASHNWHQGVVGIVASRLTERCQAPAFMICLDEEGVGKGSCRSYGGLNLFQALGQCADLLTGFGGHALAAGFTIAEEKIPAFRERMRTIAKGVTPAENAPEALKVDWEVPQVGLLTLKNVSDLDMLEPHGSGNPRPVFVLRNVSVNSVTPVGRGRHTRLRVTRDGHALDVIAFSASPESLGLRPGCRADLAFYPQINEFRGIRSVQLVLDDVHPLPSLAQQDRLLYYRWQRGEHFTRRELELLLPRRQDFVAVWRYLAAHAASDRYRESPLRLARNVAKSAGLRESYARTMICLEVFRERGLIQFTAGANQLQIRLEAVQHKVDLEASKILTDLRRMLNMD